MGSTPRDALVNLVHSVADVYKRVTVKVTYCMCRWKDDFVGQLIFSVD